MNLMLYRWGQDCLVVDAGMMFPGAEHLGVDVVIPDMSFLDECGRLLAVILTHGHEDHIGALPYLLAKHDVPVYSTPYTQGLIRHRLEEHNLLSGRSLHLLPADGAPLTFGPFQVESLTAAHSIPQARMLVLRTPLGVIVHTADFKLDPTPVDGVGTDMRRLAQLGREGVLALLSDSTNADQPGFTPSERSVRPGLEALLVRSSHRIFVTTFSSHIHRVQQLGQLAQRHGRKIALVGTSLRVHAEVAERLGLLQLPAGTRVSAETAMTLPRQQVLIVASGSQGEPMSAAARIAVGKHREVEIDTGDLVIHSARPIPGNHKSIGRMLNHFLRRGAEVVTAAEAPIHVSGHPAQDELRLLLQLLRPKYLVPIHGEYRQLHAHARLGVDCGMDPAHVQLADTGDVIALDDRTIGIRDRVRVGQVFLDATLEQVDRAMLRDRKRVAWDGLVVPVVAVDRQRGVLSGYPQILTRGFLPDVEPDEGLLLEAKQLLAQSLTDASPEERADEGLLRARIQAELKRFLRRRTQREPLILPVIVEL
jgi:ribonuclease J